MSAPPSGKPIIANTMAQTTIDEEMRETVDSAYEMVVDADELIQEGKTPQAK